MANCIFLKINVIFLFKTLMNGVYLSVGGNFAEHRTKKDNPMKL